MSGKYSDDQWGTGTYSVVQRRTGAFSDVQGRAVMCRDVRHAHWCTGTYNAGRTETTWTYRDHRDVQWCAGKYGDYSDVEGRTETHRDVEGRTGTMILSFSVVLLPSPNMYVAVHFTFSHAALISQNSYEPRTALLSTHKFANSYKYFPQ